MEPRLNMWFLRPTRVHNPNGISIGSAIYAGLMVVTDQQTDHATRSATIGRIYVVLRCDLKTKKKQHYKPVLVSSAERTVQRLVDRLSVTSCSFSRTLSLSGSRLAANFRLVNEYSCPAINVHVSYL